MVQELTRESFLLLKNLRGLSQESVKSNCQANKPGVGTFAICPQWNTPDKEEMRRGASGDRLDLLENPLCFKEGSTSIEIIAEGQIAPSQVRAHTQQQFGGTLRLRWFPSQLKDPPSGQSPHDFPA